MAKKAARKSRTRPGPLARKAAPTRPPRYMVTGRFPPDQRAAIVERMRARHTPGTLNGAVERPDFHVTTDIRATSDPLWQHLATFRRRLMEGGTYTPAEWQSLLIDIRHEAHEAGLRPHLGRVEWIVASLAEAREGDPLCTWEGEVDGWSKVVLTACGETGPFQLHDLLDGFADTGIPGDGHKRDSAIEWAESWMNARERQLCQPAAVVLPPELLARLGAGGAESNDNGAATKHTQSATRFRGLAAEFDRLGDGSTTELWAGLTNRSLQAGQALVEAIDDDLIHADAETRAMLGEWRREQAHLASIPSHRRVKRNETEALFVDWRVRAFVNYAAASLTPDAVALGSFDNRGTSESQTRLMLGERARLMARLCRMLAERLQQGPASPPLEQSDVKTGKSSVRTAHALKPTRRERRVKWLAEAMLMVQDHPDWSDAAIARHVQIDKSQLSRSREYRTAAIMARTPKTPAGSVSIADGNRELEAVDDSFDPNRPASRQWQDEEDADDRIDREMRETQRKPQRRQSEVL